MKNFLKYLYAIRVVKAAIRTYLESPLFAVSAGDSGSDYTIVMKLQQSQIRIIDSFNNDTTLDQWQRDIVAQQLDDNDLIMRTALIERSIKRKTAHTN